MSHQIFRDPVHAIGNSEDARTTNPDDTDASLIGLEKGILHALLTGISTTAPAGASTEAKQDTGNTSLATIAGKDFATQTTLAAVLAKVIAAPATEAKQDNEITQATAVNTVLGVKADAKSTATDATAVSAMSVWKQISASVQLLVFGSGTAAAAQRVTHASDDPAVATLGATTGAAVITDANGTIQQYLRGLVKRWVDALGAGTAAAALRTTLASDDLAVTSLAIMDDWDSNDACKTVGFINALSSNFTRPADTTAYAAGDLVANSTTAGSVAPMSWAAARQNGASFFVRRVRFSKSTTTVTNAQFRLHLYSASPSVTNGDNGVYSTPIAGYLGSMEIDASQGLVCSDGVVVSGVPRVGGEISVNPSATATIYGLLEARAAYAPGNAEVFTMVLEVFQN